ncbi:MAG: adenylate/guanylate cyclase domain-containing protein [Dehalococcoidia bacterium]
MSIEPQIRYATTSDGVSIAYWIMGEGPPLFVSSPLTFSHTGLELRIPAIAAFYERIARDAMLVRWDPRNYGMSQRGVERLGVEDWARDVTAVADSLHLDEFDLLAINRAHPAAALAARQPCRIRRLVLAGAAPVRLADLFADENQVAVRSLAGTNWRVYTETLAHFLQGWEPHPDLPYARFMRESIDQADYLRVMAAWREWDATPYLPNVSCPTLVVSAGDNSKHARMYAAAIPGARFLDVEVAHPNALQPNLNYTAAILSSRNAAIEEFFREGADGARRTSTRDRVRTPETHATGTAVIMFTDIVSSTELTERLGDVTFREASRALDAGLRDAIHDAGGTAIDGKLLGDGVLATFPSAAQAIGGARRCLALSAASELGLHIGLHAGDVIREENNVFGGAVNIASRICGLSAPGEILVSDVVRGMARSSAGVEFADRGEQEMKGVGEPVRVYAVRGSV